jgi:TetR/AcrR family transcriptional regulator
LTSRGAAEYAPRTGWYVVPSTALAARGASKANGEDVRRRILDAAEDVFAARGFRGATTQQIGTRAGVGKRMLFYYFPTKAAVYRAVLARAITGLVAIHARFRDEPGPVGLADAIEGITHFAAGNLRSLTLLMRAIVDGDPQLKPLARRHLRPLFATATEEIRRNMARGIFRPGDPMHVLVNVGGVTLFYFLNMALLELVWDRDPLAPGVIAERAAAARDCLLYGLLADAEAPAATRRGATS